ncbi:hypothetical protein ACQUW5_13270 [Legionella sp. CNM-1927-20]|uniref:hypothetical protein n=1 Tax=Legionella sp. CNM-1927-20 TaxID=3422221 RepID=UPI00403A7EC6
MAVTKPADSAELPPITSPNFLLLSDASGDQITLNESTLSKWLKGNLGEKFIAQHGLQDSTQVISFLNTHSGKIVREMILEELIKIAKQEEFVFKQINLELAYKQQLLAYLLLKLAYKEDEQFKRFCETVQAQIDKLLNKDKSSSKGVEAEIPLYLLSQLENLEKQAYDIKLALEATKVELTKVEKQLQEIDYARSSVVQHRSDFEILLGNLPDITNDSISLDLSDRQTQIEDNLVSLHRVADVHLRTISPNQGVPAPTPVLATSYHNLHSQTAHVRNIVDTILARRSANNNAVNMYIDDSQLSPSSLHAIAKQLSSLFMENSQNYLNHYDKEYQTLRGTQKTLQNKINTFEDNLKTIKRESEKTEKQLMDKYPSYKRLKERVGSLSQAPGFFADLTPSNSRDSENLSHDSSHRNFKK